MLEHFVLSAPLFATVLAGYAIARIPGFRNDYAKAANKLVFNLLLPALLFRILSRLSGLPPVDARLLLAFFGSCAIVFVAGRAIGARCFAMDGVAQSVFALGGVFSNNVLLGLPLAKSLLGDAALPCVALVLVFNSLTLWTLVTFSVEWARQGSFTLSGSWKTAAAVLKSPLILAILLGTAVGLARWNLPHAIELALAGIGKLAPSSALLVLGMGLAEHAAREHLKESLVLCAVKLVLQPLVVLLLALALGLPALETATVVLLGSISIGVNVYLMAAEFRALEGTIASGMVLSTALAALTTPLWVSFVQRVVGKS